MNTKRLANILDLMVEFFYSGIIFLTPLVFAFFLSNNNVFTLNKIVFFKILVCLWGSVFVLKILFFPASFWSVRNNFKQKKYLLIPLAFLLSLVVSLIFSDYKQLSFWGLYSRQQGLVSYFYFLVFFFLLLFAINNLRQLKRIFIGIALSSFIVSFYAILQIFGIDVFIWNEPAILTGRASSTLGQPNYLGSFLLLAIPFTCYLLYKNQKSLFRYLWGFVLIVNLFALYFTGSQAAGIGLAVFVFSVLAIYIQFRKRKYLGFVFLGLSGLVAVTILVVVVLFFVVNNFGGANFFKKGSVATRINIWQGAVSAIGQHPFLGYGPDSQREALAPYYKKDWAVYSDVNAIPSRAHNIFLDVLLISGLLGLFFYLALLYLFIKLIRQNLFYSAKLEAKDMQAINLLLFGGFLGYITSLMFGFSTITTDIYFWLYLAILIIINVKLQEKMLSEGGDKKAFPKIVLGVGESMKRLRLFIKIVLIFVILVVLSVQLKKQLGYLSADHYFRQVKTANVEDEYFQVLKMHTHIKNLNIRDSYYNKKISLILAKKIIDMGDSGLAELGEDVLQDSLNEIKNSQRYDDIRIKAQIYTALASLGEKDYYELAEKENKKAISIAPEIPVNYYSLANMLAKKGDYQEAINNYVKALERLPNVENSYINRRHTQRVKNEKYLNYKAMADVFFAKEEYSLAREYYWLSYKNNLSDIPLYKKIADTYYKQDNLDKAIEVNKKGYTLAPKDHTWPFVIALLYREKGSREEALKYGKEALKLSPVNKQIKNFVDQLK